MENASIKTLQRHEEAISLMQSVANKLGDLDCEPTESMSENIDCECSNCGDIAFVRTGTACYRINCNGRYTEIEWTECECGSVVPTKHFDQHECCM